MRNYYEQVHKILERWQGARDDDMLLYAIFLHMNNYVGVEERFYDVMSTARARGLPSYESITRARRKVQEKEPNLRGQRYKKRMEEESAYHKYYRNN